MKKYTTTQRLKQIMEERGLKQVKILEMSKPYQEELGIYMSKSSLSEYINGKSNPDQRKLTLLGSTLGVSEAWLMGYDVDKVRGNSDIVEMLALDSNKVNKNIVSRGREEYISEVGDTSIIERFEKEIKDSYQKLADDSPNFTRVDDWTEKWLNSFYTSYYFAESHTKTVIARYYTIPINKREPIDILLNSLSNYLIEDRKITDITIMKGTVHIEED